MKKFIIFLSLIFVKNTSATNYPTAAADRLVNTFVTIATSVFKAGDTISIGSGATDQGLCWLKTRLDTNATGTGYIEVATPLPVYTGLYLSRWNTLDIQKDMFLSGDCQLRRSGKISSGMASRAESSLILLGAFNLNDCTLTFTASSASDKDQPGYIDGNGNVIDFSNGGAIDIDTGPRGELKIRNAFLKGISGTNLAATTGNLSLDNVVLQLNGDYSVGSAKKALNVYGDLVVTGTYVFTIDGPCNIYDDARIYFDIGTTFKVGSNAVFNAYGSKTGGFYFNGSTINISSKHFLLNEGSIFFENQVNINDGNSYKNFVVGPHCAATGLATARIILDGKTTFSVL